MSEGAELYSLDRRWCVTCKSNFWTACEITPVKGSQGKLRHGWVIDSHTVSYPLDQDSQTFTRCIHCARPGLYPPEAGNLGVFKLTPVNRIRSFDGKVTIT